MVALGRLQPNPLNPRPVLDEWVEELMNTFRANPESIFLYPILARKMKGDELEIISGHHRAEAFRRLGMSEAPVHIAEMDDETAEMEVLLANKSLPLSQLDYGRHFKALHQLHPELTQKEYAKRIGKTTPYMTQAVQVATLYQSIAPELRSEVDSKAKADGGISTHLLTVAQNAPPEVWDKIVASVLANDFSVRDVKEFITQALKTFGVIEKSAELQAMSGQGGSSLTPLSTIFDEDTDTGGSGEQQSGVSLGSPREPATIDFKSAINQEGARGMLRHAENLLGQVSLVLNQLETSRVTVEADPLTSLQSQLDDILNVLRRLPVRD
jgi:ParB/RepB/Spo0J family partition protein